MAAQRSVEALVTKQQAASHPLQLLGVTVWTLDEQKRH
jgi:hypothetical protein